MEFFGGIRYIVVSFPMNLMLLRWNHGTVTDCNGHLEKFKVPMRCKDALPFSMDAALIKHIVTYCFIS